MRARPTAPGSGLFLGRAGFTPEAELLVRCARSSVPADTAVEIRSLIESGIDWKRFIRLAHEHRVACLVYRSLTEVGAAGVPGRALQRLQFRYQANAAVYLQLCHRLVQVLELLESEGLPVLTLKGPALATQAYAEPSVREFRDLDILVKREDALRAREVLETAGYASYPQFTAPQLRVFMRSECEFWFSSPGDEVPLELHWDLREPVYAYPLDPEECWRDAGTCEIAGRPVAVLSPEHTLLMLSCHGAKHRWAQLKLIVDLAELLRSHPGLDWDALLSRAASLRGLRMLLVGLQLARELLQAPLPEPVERASQRDPALAALTQELIIYLFTEGRGSRQEVAGTRLYLRMRERPQERLRYVLGTLFTPTLEDWSALTLPEPLFPLYYLVRPLRLLTRSLVRWRTTQSPPTIH